MWMKHGALQYFECVGEDLKSAKKWGCLPFPKQIGAKPGETVIFAFIRTSNRTAIRQNPISGVAMS